MDTPQSAHAPSIPAVQTHQLTRRYGEMVALDQLNLTIQGLIWIHRLQRGW